MFDYGVYWFRHWSLNLFLRLGFYDRKHICAMKVSTSCNKFYLVLKEDFGIGWLKK